MRIQIVTIYGISHNGTDSDEHRTVTPGHPITQKTLILKPRTPDYNNTTFTRISSNYLITGMCTRKRTDKSSANLE